MNWQPANSSAWHQLSEDGRYSVCRIVTAYGAIYEAWRTRAHPDGPGLLKTKLATSQDGRDAAEAYDSKGKP